MNSIITLALTLCVAVCGPAAAQTTPPKPAAPQPAKTQPGQTKPAPKKKPRTRPLWYIGADVGAQPIKSFSHTVETKVSAETQTVTTDYSGGTGILGGGTVGYLFGKQVGAGVSFSYLSHAGSGHVDASVPHPFFFNQPRQISGDTSDLSRGETTFNFLLLYLPKPGKHLRLVFSGGPSYLNVQQDLVTDVQYSETYPYDTAAFTGAKTERASKGVVGVNAGADVIWMFNKRTGLAGVLRYTYGSVDLPLTGGGTVPVTAGGVQGGVGFRILY